MLLAATLFMLIPSMALGALTEEAFEQWYEHMTYLVDGIGEEPWVRRRTGLPVHIWLISSSRRE